MYKFMRIEVIYHEFQCLFYSVSLIRPGPFFEQKTLKKTAKVFKLSKMMRPGEILELTLCSEMRLLLASLPIFVLF